MKRVATGWRILWILLLAGVAGACSAPPKTARFLDAAAWPEAHSVALVGVSFDARYRPVPQSGMDRDLLIQLRRALEAKGYRALEPEQLNRVELKSLSTVPPAELAGRAMPAADLALAVHVDFLFSSATYAETNPPPEFEIAAEARVVDVAAERDLWRDRAHVLEGGAAAFPLRDPSYDRLRGLTELARQLVITLPDAGTRPAQPQGY